MEIPTNMHLLVFLAACVLFTTTECQTSFQNCPGGSVDVEQNTVFDLSCEDYSAPQITWEYKSGQSAFSTIGRCYNDSTSQLESTYNGIFTLTATSGTSSDLGLTLTFTAGLKTATFSCDGVECVVSIVAPTTTQPTTTTTEATTEATTKEATVREGPSDGEIAGIVIGSICGVGLIIGVGVLIWCKKEQKSCFKPKTEDGRGSNVPMNGSAHDKPPNPPRDNAVAVPADGRARDLPQPNCRPGATVTPNETPMVVVNASPSPRPRELPHPKITEHSMTTPLPPSLPPIRTQAVTPLPSVERNSNAESKKPLPSISPREAQ